MVLNIGKFIYLEEYELEIDRILEGQFFLIAKFLKVELSFFHFCGSKSRCFFDPWIRNQE
jgi:hypothetical protein